MRAALRCSFSVVLLLGGRSARPAPVLARFRGESSAEDEARAYGSGDPSELS